MKIQVKRVQTRMHCIVALGIISSFSLAAAAENSADIASAKSSRAIPRSAISAKAGADYQGDELAIISTANGARLRCVFQRLEGDATREGLWLSSTVNNAANDRFRVVAADVRRLTSIRNLKSETRNEVQSLLASAATDQGSLPRKGTVAVEGQTVRFTRPGLVEEYTASMDGVRQDFVVLARPEGMGELAVRLAVSGATVEPAASGARLVLENSGRKIAYSRLRVTDATGRELTARMEEAPALRQAGMPAAAKLTVLVNDADAVYPVRIDPTFSDANWINMGPSGTDTAVHDMVVDGSGNLYIAGEFTIAGDAFATRVAKWDGSNWTALGSGMTSAPASFPFVRALAILGNDLYAAGYFTTAGGNPANFIAKWDGNSWTALGSGLNSSASALAVSGSDLYVGGTFTNAGGNAANRIAKWDGNRWTALGSGLNGAAGALAVSGSNVYAGGNFTTAGGNPANYIAKWDGNSWTGVGSGLNGAAYTLAVSGNDLYVGGTFTMADGNAANYIAKWNGNSWTALGSGMGGGWATGVYALAVSGSDLYAGGNFTTAGGSSANYIARWNGSSWTALSSGMSSDPGDVRLSVSALVVSGSDLYVGGQFTKAGGNPANHIARWNGSGWTALPSGSGVDNEVMALAVSGSDLYAGGLFTTAGTSAANKIARWNGSGWTAVGSGMTNFSLYTYVSALGVSGSDLYAGGYFSSAGDSAAYNIAKWNGSTWAALGSGLDDWVNVLAVSGSDLYVGGNFRWLDSSTVTVNYIAKWNGSSWTALGAGMSSNVLALAVSGSNLYAGGAFTRAGNSAANYIARWNGSAWSALDAGMNSNVLALAASGSDLYAGGMFTTAGGNPAHCIAKWNGSNWTPLGSGMSGGSSPAVYAITVSGSDLYAGGRFTMAGGNPARNIARWNGSTWSAMGSGIASILPGARVDTLALLGSDLYVGGRFTVAGGKVSANIARAYLPDLPALSVLHSGTDVVVSWPSADGAGFALEQSGTLATPTSWVTNAASVTDDGANKSVAIPATNSMQSFRLRSP